MQCPVPTEAIYDAALDDEAFGHLASQLADAIGARSGVIHWRCLREETEEVSYSGYFPASAMAEFERHFADADIWSEAIRAPERANRVWSCEQFVPESAYARSRVYNEWIRPMGDDTFHAMGGAIRTEEAVGELGFHRGKVQGGFEEEAVQAVNSVLPHLRRMLTMRSRLRASEQVGEAMAAALDVSIHAIFTLSLEGDLLHANSAGEALLRRGDAFIQGGRRLRARTPGDDNLLEVAIARAASTEGTQGSALFIRRPAAPAYDVSIASASSDGAARHIIMIVTDPTALDSSLGARVQSLFGLTLAEAEVAVGIALGKSPERLAHERRVAVGTIRAQIKSVSAKTGCSRQTELAALINGLPRLS